MVTSEHGSNLPSAPRSHELYACYRDGLAGASYPYLQNQSVPSTSTISLLSFL